MDRTKRYGSLEAIQKTNFIDEEIILSGFLFRGMPCRLLAGYDDDSNLAFFLRWGENVAQIGEILSLRDYEKDALENAESGYRGNGLFQNQLDENSYCRALAFDRAAADILKWDLSGLSDSPQVVHALKKYLIFVYIERALITLRESLDSSLGKGLPMTWNTEKEREYLEELANNLVVTPSFKTENSGFHAEGSENVGFLSSLSNGCATGCGCLVFIILLISCLVFIILLIICFSGC